MVERESAVKVLVYGAGVIGQIYAGRIAEAGHDVTVLDRGAKAGALAQRGISLQSPQGLRNVRVAVVEQVDPTITWDLALVTVRRDQLDPVLPVLADLASTHIVFMLNQPLDGERAARAVGADRTLFAFPGVGGSRSEDGTIVYIEIPQQRTTIGIQHGRERPLVDLLCSARFPVATTNDMPAWLATHAVFVAAVGAAIAAAGNASSLAANRAAVRTMVKAIREGFRALAKTGTQVTPLALRTIFTLVPAPFAVRYWQRQLAGPVGTVAIAPHVLATRTTELPALCNDVRRMVAPAGPTPRLTALLDGVDVS
jgi:2-dehydropantoate 2-reductase